MSYLSEAHSEWHYVNRATPWNCPLDCGAGEPDWDDHMTDEELAEYDAWAAASAAERTALIDEVIDDNLWPGDVDWSEPPF